MRASRLEIVLTVTVWTSVLSDKDFLEHAVSSDGGVESPPKYTRPWGGWTPPEAGALRAFEVGFSEAIDARSMLLKKDLTPRMAYQGVCNTSHMTECQYCPVQRKALQDMHEQAGVKELFEHNLLLMIDDRPLESWSGLRRFLRPAIKFEPSGLEGVDSYCSAWHDGDFFEMVYPRGRVILRSMDGVRWERKGATIFRDDPGWDVCMDRVKRASEPAYYVAVGIGATQCTIRQPRLFEVHRQPSTANLVGSALWFGADSARSAAIRGCKNRPWEFLRTNHSLLAAGGDTCTHVYHNAHARQDALTTRLNVCTRDPEGGIRWREIRGLQVRSYSDARGLRNETRAAQGAWKIELETYLDLDSKSDRYRMQIYNLQARVYPFPDAKAEQRQRVEALAPKMATDKTRFPLHIGVFTILNYPKAAVVPTFAQNCSTVRGGHQFCDTVDVFLATSRDGVHFDASWIYAREPLVQRGVEGSAADSRMVLGCGQPFAHGNFVYYYYVGYPVSHEDRPSAQKQHTYRTLGAKWPIHAMVGLEPESQPTKGILVTKPFVKPRHLSFLVEEMPRTQTSLPDVPPEMVVDILDERGRVFQQKYSAFRAISTSDHGRLPCTLDLFLSHITTPGGSDAMHIVKLRLELRGVRLYAIRRGAHFGHNYNMCSAHSAYPLTPEFTPPAGDPFLQQENQLLEQHRSVYGRSPSTGKWIPAAIRTTLQGWRARKWDVKNWTMAHSRDWPVAMVIRISRGQATLQHMAERGYKRFRVDAYMRLLGQVAKRDPTLNVTVVAWPSDGCPGNSEHRIKTCAWVCAGPKLPFTLNHKNCTLPKNTTMSPAPRSKHCNECKAAAQPSSGTVHISKSSVPVPILCFQKDISNTHAALLPEIQFLYQNYYAQERKMALNDVVPWKDKRPSAFFHGSHSGSHDGMYNQRLRVCSQHNIQAHGVDFVVRANTDPQSNLNCNVISCNADSMACTGTSASNTPQGCQLARMSDGSQAIVSHRASWNDAIQYKYLLSLDGHGAACERLFMSLLSNSVVLKMEATHPLSTRSILYYFPALKAWEHFVPVGEDNITETIKWLIEHDAEAQRIQANARRFVQEEYTREVAERYTHLLLSTLAALHV